MLRTNHALIRSAHSECRTTLHGSRSASLRAAGFLSCTRRRWTYRIVLVCYCQRYNVDAMTLLDRRLYYV